MAMTTISPLYDWRRSSKAADTTPTPTPSPQTMGGGLLEWRWGRNTTTQQTNNKKDKSSSSSRKKSTRRVRFKEGNSGGEAAGSSSGVVQGKEKKRVWFSRIWLSIRRKEGRRRPPPEKTAIELPSKSTKTSYCWEYLLSAFLACGSGTWFSNYFIIKKDKNKWSSYQPVGREYNDGKNLLLSFPVVKNGYIFVLLIRKLSFW